MNTPLAVPLGGRNPDGCGARSSSTALRSYVRLARLRFPDRWFPLVYVVGLLTGVIGSTPVCALIQRFSAIVPSTTRNETEFRVDAHVRRQDSEAGRRRGRSLLDHSEDTVTCGDSWSGAGVRASPIAGPASRYGSGAHGSPRIGVVAPYSLSQPGGVPRGVGTVVRHVRLPGREH